MKCRLLKYKRHQQYIYRKVMKRRRKKRSSTKNYQRKAALLSINRAVRPLMNENHIAQILEYSVLFGKKNIPTIDSLISKIPRETVINLSGVLSNLYGNAKLEKLDMFFSSKSIHNREEINKCLNYFYDNHRTRPTLFWATSESPLQLMRHAFAFPFDKIEDKEVSDEEAEMKVFKIIQLMNEEATKYHIKKQDANPVNMMFLLSVLNINMHGQEVLARKNRSIMQMRMAVEFFEFLTTQPKYKPLYEAFLKKHGVNYWQLYVRSVFGILAMLKYKAGRIPAGLHTDEENLVEPEVFKSICLNYNNDIKYYSDNPTDREGDTDYKTFRNTPIIKMSDGSFYAFSWEFVIDRLYNSLYFEFKDLPVGEKLQKKVAGLFTDKFAEKIMFDRLLEESASNKRYRMLSEEEMAAFYPIEKRKKRELGPPDYMLETNNTYILFECKDVRIGGEEIESHDFDTIIDIFSNKLYWKKWKYKDDGSKYYFTADDKTERRIGITQLTGHIDNIRREAFHYYNTHSTKKIYPVLVLSDAKNVHRGFTHIANDWYRTSLNKLGVDDVIQNRPLIVMSFMALIKYHDLFLQNGFEYYFECYYKQFNTKYRNAEEAMKVTESFDDYMNQYPFDLSPLHERLMEQMKVGVKETPTNLSR